jgi:hypothetical protein
VLLALSHFFAVGSGSLHTFSTRAHALFFSFRQAGATFPGSSGTVEGTAYRPQTIVVVRWGWISLFLCYAVLAAVFLALVICWTFLSGIPILKRSSLAMLVAADTSLRGKLGTLDESDNLKQNAKETSARLDGRHLVLSGPTDQVGG